MTERNRWLVISVLAFFVYVGFFLYHVHGSFTRVPTANETPLWVIAICYAGAWLFLSWVNCPTKEETE